MAQLFTNNARATITSSITADATSIVIDATKADLFPVATVGSGSIPSSGDWFKLTLQDSVGNVEIVAVRTRAAGSSLLSNVIRGYDGTTARAFTSGTVIGLRLTAEDVQTALAITSENNVFTGDNSFTGTNEFTGSQTFSGLTTFSDEVEFNDPVTGDLIGDVTGNLTGNVTGDVTGNVSGSAGSLLSGLWTVSDIAGKLTFKYNNVAVFSITSAGAIVAKDDVTGFGTP
jgi:hypothetical protein